MRESAERFWARSRYEFFKCLPDADADDAADFMFAALDAYRRNVPIDTNDLLLVKSARGILKQTDLGGIKPVRELYDYSPKMVAHPPANQGTLPREPHSDLKEIISAGEWEDAQIDEGDSEAVRKEKVHKQTIMLWKMASGRMETAPAIEGDMRRAPGSDAVRPDRHPMMDIGLFENKHSLLPSAPVHQTYRYLYRDGSGAREFDEGLDAHESKYADYPHNSDSNFGKHTGQVSLSSLYERGFNKWLDRWQNNADENGWEKPEDGDDEYRQMFMAHKLLEWEGYNPDKLLDEETGRHNESGLAEKMSEEGVRNPNARLGFMSHLYGLEMLEPQERLHVMRWLLNGAPHNEEAREDFDNLDFHGWEHWLPFLKRQKGMVRGPRVHQKTRAFPYIPGAIVNWADNNEVKLRDVGEGAGSEAIGNALDRLHVTEHDGVFSHYGDEEEGSMSARHHIMRNALGEENLMDEYEHMLSGLNLPTGEISDEGMAIWGGQKGQEEESHLTPQVIDQYVENGWLDESVRDQLFNEGVAEKHQQDLVGGAAIRQVGAPAIGGLNADGTPSFSHMFDMDGGGMGLDENAYLHGVHQMYPGVFTGPVDKMLMEPNEQWFDTKSEEGLTRQEAMLAWPKEIERFAQAGGPEGAYDKPIVPHDEMQSMFGYARTGEFNRSATQSHLNPSNVKWRSPNMNTLTPGFVAKKGKKLPTYHGNPTSMKSQFVMPQTTDLIAALCGLARPADRHDRPLGSEGESTHMIPTDGLDKLITTHGYWDNGWLPGVDKDHPTGEQNEEQIGRWMREMGFSREAGDKTRYGDLSDKLLSPEDDDLGGGYSFYSVEPKGDYDQHSLSSLLSHYDNVAGGMIDTSGKEEMPIFNPDAFIADDHEGEPRINLDREEASQYLLEHGDFGPNVPQSVPQHMSAEQLANTHNILSDDPSAAKVNIHSLTGGPGQKPNADAVDGSNFSFPLQNGNRAFMSREHPVDMAEYFLDLLEGLPAAIETADKAKKEKGPKRNIDGLNNAIERQRQIVNDLRDRHTPLVPLETADNKSSQSPHRRRVAQIAEDCNNTHAAIEAVLPVFKELAEKHLGGGLFDSTTDNQGEEDWNAATPAHMALVEAAERYVANHQTPEMNKKLGIGDENGNIMSHHDLPLSIANEGVKPNDEALHDRIQDFKQKGNPSMLHLFHEWLDPYSRVFNEDAALPPVAGAEPTGPTTDEEHMRDIIKHAIARVKATQHPEWKSKNPAGAVVGKAGEKDRKRRHNWVTSFMDDLDDSSINTMLKNHPEEIAQSLSDRFAKQSGSIHGKATPYKWPASTEAELMDRMYKKFRHELTKNTNWEAGTKGAKGSAGGKSARRKSQGKADDIIGKLSRYLGQPLQNKSEGGSENDTVFRPQPLGRMNAGTQTIMPLYTSPAIKRHHGYPTKPPFTVDYDKRTGEPVFLENVSQPKISDLALPPISLMRIINEGIMPMDFAANKMAEMGDYFDIDTADTKPQLSHLGRRNTKPTKINERFRRGEPLERLTFLDILKEEDEEREKGDASPIKAAHRIFDLSDLEDLRGFSGEWIVNSWPEGQRVIIERDDDDVKVTGATISDELEESVKEINEKNFVVDAIYDGKVLHIVDLLRVATEDVTEEMLKHRMRALRGSFEANEKVKTPQPINTRQTDDEGLAESVKEIEGGRIMLRDSESTYMEGEARHPKWVLLDDEKRVSVIILGQRGQNNPVYRLGIGPVSDEIAEKLGNRAAKVDGKQYMDIGTASGDGSFDEGDFATVSVGSVSRRERGGESVYALHGAKLQGAAESKATDSIATLGMLTKSGIPHIPHSVAVEGVKVIVSLPTIDDDVIYKARRLENETGVLLDVWRIGKGESLQGDYPVRVAETLRPCWEPLAALMLKGVAKIDYDPREYMHDKKRKKKAEVTPDPRPEDKKPKKIMPNQLLKDPVIVKALLVLEELLAKEKMTWTGPKGLAVGLGTEDAAPRGPTELTRPETLPDFYPDGREKEKTPESGSKSKKNSSITTEEGEKARLSITDEEAVLELRAD